MIVLAPYVVLTWSLWCVASCSLENVWYFRFATGPQSSVRGQYYLRKDALRYLQGALEELSQSQNLEKIAWDQHETWLRGVFMKNRKAARVWDQLEIPLYLVQYSLNYMLLHCWSFENNFTFAVFSLTSTFDAHACV